MSALARRQEKDLTKRQARRDEPVDSDTLLSQRAVCQNRLNTGDLQGRRPEDYLQRITQIDTQLGVYAVQT